MNIYKEIQTSLDEAVLDADGFYDSTKFDYETLQDFLKQSFIKYLQSEVERLKATEKETYKTNRDFIYDQVEQGYNQAISDQITHLQAQVKELES